MDGETRVPTPRDGTTTQLLSALVREARERAETNLADTGVSLRGHWLLLRLGDTGLAQGEAGDTIGIDRSDMVRLVDSLEKNGLVKRRKDPSDRRRQILEITGRGRRMRARTSTLVRAAEDDAFMALSKKQTQRLHDLVDRALRGLDSPIPTSAHAEEHP